jgi:branched-chain amino acid transport system ATP-binding protein
MPTPAATAVPVDASDRAAPAIGVRAAGDPVQAAAPGLSLDVQGVDLRFGGTHALRGVSFAAAPGQITAVIGPNGAGKTSVFNTISGFYRPAAGTIHLGDVDITRVPVHARAGMGLARTFQNIALYRGLTVLENIKLGGHHVMHAGVLSALTYGPKTRAEENALRAEIERRVIDFLEIDHIRHRSVDALPYGLQKRVELARALAMRPRVVLLDEPVAGMNREETEDMARFILDVQEEWGVTVLLVEHDMGMVMDISSHVVVLNFGQVIAAGTPAEVRRHPQVIEAYLGAEGGVPAPAALHA